MYIGESILLKHNEKVQEGKIENIYIEDLEIRLKNGELIKRKFWEIRRIPDDYKKEN